MGFAASSSSSLSAVASPSSGTSPTSGPGAAWAAAAAREAGTWLAPLVPIAGWLRRRALLAGVPGRATRAVSPLPLAHRSPQAQPANDAVLTPRPPRPLRVLRVADGASRQCAGRMVISGRMADVCAELDRLAARETPRPEPSRRPAAH